MNELFQARKVTRLKEGFAAIQQQALRDLDRALHNWYKHRDHFERPTWHKKDINEGFAMRDLSVRRLNRKWDEVFIPTCGWVKFRVTREWSDIETASSARVTLDRSGRWFVSFTRPAPQIERKENGVVVGIDMGVTHTVATSKGKFLDMPELLSKAERRRKRRLQRKLARQTKGSTRRKATRLAITKLAAKESDRRKDWIEKTTTDLVCDYDLIALEALQVKNMTRSAKGTKDKPGRNVRAKSGLKLSMAISTCTGVGHVPQTTCRRSYQCYNTGRNHRYQSRIHEPTLSRVWTHGSEESQEPSSLLLSLV